ncbi:hypothetical protein F5B18DRAFT_599951 [Nemania serpens]|nr:hypothetical protein F5B18DRAFT_599951 [Nemania serpens]
MASCIITTYSTTTKEKKTLDLIHLMSLWLGMLTQVEAAERAVWSSGLLAVPSMYYCLMMIRGLVQARVTRRFTLSRPEWRGQKARRIAKRSTT